MRLLIVLLFFAALLDAKIQLGIERLVFEREFHSHLVGKRVALVTNQTAITSDMQSAIELLKKEARDYRIVAFFAPEHGLKGQLHAAEDRILENKDEDGLPIYPLYGATRRPSESMLKDIDVIIYDIQDIGSRSYTFSTTLFYLMEEAAKHKIEVIVADRPNPLGGECVDGLFLDPKWRSFIGYINVPYCHGMTIGELSLFFNDQYKVGCNLLVVPMKGWKRNMTFEETGLPWVPTSPQIPEPDSPFFYPITGLLGELCVVNIGVGYTLPFKVVGAPWIDAEKFAKALNAQNFPGVRFRPIYYQPFFGNLKKQNCQGVQIILTDKHKFMPVETHYLILGTLKSLYPKQMRNVMQETDERKELFCKANGTDEVLRLLAEEKYIVFKLREQCRLVRKQFLKIRQPYLLPEYSSK